MKITGFSEKENKMLQGTEVCKVLYFLVGKLIEHPIRVMSAHLFRLLRTLKAINESIKLLRTQYKHPKSTPKCVLGSERPNRSSYACVHTRGWCTPTTSKHNIFDSDKLFWFLYCAPDRGPVRTSGLMDLESDALPTEPPRHLKALNLILTVFFFFFLFFFGA